MIVRSELASTGPGVQAGRINTPLRRVLVAGVGLLCACAAPRVVPSGVPTPSAPAPTVAPPPRERTVALVTPSTDARFLLSTTATIIASADTLVRHDSATTVTALRVTPRGSAFDIVLDSHVVHLAGAAPVRLPPGTRALARLASDTGYTFVGGGTEDACASVARAAFEATRDLWVTWPTTVRASSRWADTTRTTVCRDRIPLTMTLVRDYQLTGPLNDSLLVVQRSARVLLDGRGALRGDTTQITATGTSDATLYLRPTTGWIDSARVRSTLRLTARGSVRTQQVEQRSESRIHRAPNIP